VFGQGIATRFAKIAPERDKNPAATRPHDLRRNLQKLDFVADLRGGVQQIFADAEPDAG